MIALRATLDQPVSRLSSHTTRIYDTVELMLRRAVVQSRTPPAARTGNTAPHRRPTCPPARNIIRERPRAQAAAGVVRTIAGSRHRRAASAIALRPATDCHRTVFRRSMQQAVGSGSFATRPGSIVDSLGSFVIVAGSLAGFSGEMSRSMNHHDRLWRIERFMSRVPRHIPTRFSGHGAHSGTTRAPMNRYLTHGSGSCL